MFKKITSSLSFSPLLIESLNSYSQKLKADRKKYGISIFFLIFTLVIQIVVFSNPPEPANTTSPGDLVIGGVSSIDEFLEHYHKNNNGLRDIMNTIGITESEISNAQSATWHVTSNNPLFVFSRKNLVGQSDGGKQHYVANQNSFIYSKPYGHFIPQHASIKQEGWTGNSSKVGHFRIQKYGGNVAVKEQLSTSALLNNEQDLEKSLSVENINDPANSYKAKPDDELKYTLSIKNIGAHETKTSFNHYIGDILEYAKLKEHGNEIFDQSAKTISWTEETLQPGQTITKDFVVKIDGLPPTTPTGVSDGSSYDCTLTNTFGKDTSDVKLACRSVKFIEKIISELPQTKQAIPIAINSVILCLVVFMYLRNGQINKEIRLIRRNLNSGVF